MLDILIIFLDVCKHMMHVVFRVPPLQGKSTDEACLEPTEDVQGAISAVGCGMADPTYEDLGEAETEDA